MKPLIVCLALAPAACSLADRTEDAREMALRDHAGAWEQLAAAEDARARLPLQLATLVEGTRSEVPELRALAIRGLGRLERPDQLPVIVGSLLDSVASVRSAAAEALVRTSGDAEADDVRRLLVEALGAEADVEVRETMLESLGRIPVDSGTGASGVLHVLLSHLEAKAASAPEAIIGANDGAVNGSGSGAINGAINGAGSGAGSGAIRGLYFLSRQPTARPAFDAVAFAALHRLASQTASQGDLPSSARMRLLAVASTIEAGGVNSDFLEAILDDPDPQVRRVAAAGLASIEDVAELRRLAKRALSDTAGVVRYDALRVYANGLARTDGCEPVRLATTDTDAHVSLLALDLLATRCETGPGDVERLDALAADLPGAMPGTTTDDAGGPGGREAGAGISAGGEGDAGSDGGTGAAWHRPARALVSLARIAPAAASRRLPSFAAHPNLFVRAHAAQAAALTGDTAILHDLAFDEHPNVRTEALRGMQDHSGIAAAGLALAQLSKDDSQLLQAAAGALAGFAGHAPEAPSTSTGGATKKEAVDALLDALDRVSRLRRETSRDARRALLDRIAELGSAADHRERVLPYLRDFDPVIAALASDVLLTWTGERIEPAPTAPPALPFPTFEEVAGLAGSRWIIEMEGGGEVELRLLPFDAPTNAARFARLARRGYYDGLTLHRVVPNFVVQGGSPNANEYMGDGAFTRDELGHPNWRGTVGLSTRGRDTGDAQFYINTADNVRLDLDYTVFAVVERGMAVVDRQLEGAVIRTIRNR